MSGKQFEFSMVFRANVASGKAAIADLTNTLRDASTAGDKAGASARKQAADLEDLAQATAKATAGQEELVAAEQRAQAVRAKSVVAPAVSFAPMQAAFKATETAAGNYRGVVLGARVTTAGLAADLVETASASRIYQSALDDIRATFNPLFAASRQYEMQLDRIAEAEKLGAITAREAAAARLSAADILTQKDIDRAANQRTHNAVNVGAQGFDVGVTALMGMNPMMIGLQQGTQLAGIAQEMGGGAKAAKEMAAGIMSIFSPTTFVIVGLTTMAAVGIQVFSSLASAGKTLEDRLGDLKTAFDRYKSSAQVSGQSTEEMVRQFGLGAGAAQGLYTALAKIDRLSLDQKLKAVSSAVRETIGMSANDPRFGNTNRISQFFDLGSTMFAAKNPNTGRAAALNKTIREFEAAEGIDAQTAAMQKLVEQTVELATLKGGISEDEQALIDVLKEQVDVLLGIQAIETARAETLKRQIDQMVLGYSQEAELQAASLQFGSDAAAVEQIRARHARENLDIRLEEMGVEKGSVEWLKAKVGLSLQFAAQEATRAEAAKDRVRDQEDELAAINREIALIGVSNAERARANALAEADIEIRQRKLLGLDAEAEKHRAIAKAEAEIALEQRRALTEIGTASLMDGYDARIASARNPFVKAEIEAEKEYARVLGETGDAMVAAASAENVRAKALGDVAREQDDLLRGQAEGLQQLQLELALVGQTAEVRARVLALTEAERDIQRLGLTGRDAELARQNAATQAELTRQIEASANAWGRVQAAGEGAVDAVLDKLRGGDIAGAFEALAAEIEKGLFDLAIRNPLKNALFGTNLGTLEEVGGLGGIWGKLTGKNGVDEAGLVAKAAMPVGTMSVIATTVMIGGAGAQTFMSGMSGPAANGMGGGNWGGSLGGSTDVQSRMWSFFAAKGLKPHQIAAIMGNANAESGFDPYAKGDAINGQYTSFGLFQHHKGRADGLLASTGGLGGLGNVEAQLEYVWKELLTSETGVLSKLIASTDVQSATAAFVGYERPQGWSAANPMGAHNWEGRLGAAEAALAKFGTTATSATMNLGTLGSGFDLFGTALAQGLNGAVSGGGQGGLMGFLGTLATGIAGSLGIPGFAGGGDHRGGLRIVGERGPELEFTGPSRILDAQMTRSVLSTRPALVANSASPVIQLQPVLVNNTSRQVDLEVEETTDARGQRQQRYVISDVVGDGLATPGGKAARNMQQVYGVNRSARRRS